MNSALHSRKYGQGHCSTTVFYRTHPCRTSAAYRTEGAAKKRLGKARGAAGGGKKNGPRGAFVSRRDFAPTQAELGFAGDAGKKRLARVMLVIIERAPRTR